MASLSSKNHNKSVRRNKYEGRNRRLWIINNNVYLVILSQLSLMLCALITFVSCNPLFPDTLVALNNSFNPSVSDQEEQNQQKWNGRDKVREARTYPSPYPGYGGSDNHSYPYSPYGSQQYDYSSSGGGSYPSYSPPNPNYSHYPNQYQGNSYPSQYQNQPAYNYPQSSPYQYAPHSSSSYYPSSYPSPPYPSPSYASHGYPSSSHYPQSSPHSPSAQLSSNPFSTSSSSDDGPVFLGGVFDLKEFSKMSNIPIEELIKMGSSTGLKSSSDSSGRSKDHKRNKDEESEEDDDDEISEVTRRRINQSSVERRKKKKKKKRRKAQVSDIEAKLFNNRGGGGGSFHRRGSEDEDYHEEEEEEEERKEKLRGESGMVTNDEEEEEEDVVLKISRERGNKKSGSKGQKSKWKNGTSSTIPPPVMQGAYPMMPVPFPFPVAVATSGFGPSGQQQQLPSSSSLQSEESQLSPTSVKIGKKPTRLDVEEETQTVVSRPVKENIINVNLPDLFGPDGIFDTIDTNRGDMFGTGTGTGIGSLMNHRKISISGFTQGIVKRALKSIVYRIFPSVKNAKRVAAKGCRDVQTIGSMDSILMPLGIAVTLHPLLLPLVPFLLLALGSIKAIESATCFVSEFFK